MQDRLQKLSRVSVHYSIKWIAEYATASVKIMKKTYKARREYPFHHPLDYSLGEMMRNKIPSIKKDVLAGKAKDVRIVIGSALVLATPPRLYTEWGRSFLKSDICVMGPKSRETEIVRSFEREKANSLKEKKKVPQYLSVLRPFLDLLFEKGLIIGVIGRGSYFGKNGFPEKLDDINFMLFARNHSDETEKKIVDVIKRIPKFKVLIVKKKEELIKPGRSPDFSFILLSKDMAPYIKTTEYERYVLKDGVGIPLTHLTKNKSETLAKEFIKLLPKPK